MIKRILQKNAINITLAIVTFIVLFPIAMTFVYSFVNPMEILVYIGAENPSGFCILGIKLIPDMISLQQYYGVLIDKAYNIKYLLNSFMYSTAIVSGQLIIAPLAAFFFSKFKFRFREGLFFVYLVIMVLPFQAVMVPNYMMLSNLKLLDTAGAIILPAIFMPFAVFLLRQYMLLVPDEILEAAQIDGAGSFRTLINILLPSIAPGLAAMAVLSFADSWNMIEQPFLFLSDSSKYPLSLALSQYNILERREIFAASVLFIIPILILYFIFKKDIQAGLEKIKF